MTSKNKNLEQLTNFDYRKILMFFMRNFLKQENANNTWV